MRAWILPLQLAAVLAAALAPLPLSAYTLAPSLVTLRSAGSDSSTFFRLENKHPKAAAVEITIHEHRKDLDGNTVEGPPADDDFIIYPSQLVMVPGDEVAVQVRWIGDPALAAERAFTLVAREVRIPREREPEPVTGVRIEVTVLVNYEGRIYVAPPGARPNVVVESVAGDAAELEVILVNKGTAHEELAELSLVILPVDAAGTLLRQQAVTVPGRDIPAARRHLLAGERRRLRIPRPPTLPAGNFHVVLSR